ncbi:hypothetical protein UlMin_026758 [Ulmus minor]
MESSAATPMVNKNGSRDYCKKQSSKGGWNAALFIIFVEVADRFAYYGLAGNLIMYLTNELHQSISMAAKNVNMWVGVSALFPVLGALLADSFIGRFNTIILSSLVYIVGMVLVCFSVSIVPMHYREAIFFLAIYVVAIGEGGHKPCVQTFAADQFDEDSPAEREAKSSFFNWWYIGIVVGSTAAILLVVYVQDDISWTVGYVMLAVVLVAALGLFLLGMRRYRKQLPVGSPLTTVGQVLVAAARKWRVEETHHSLLDDGRFAEGRVRHSTTRTKQFRFLDKAMIIDSYDASRDTRNPWRLCSLKEVEEVKLVFRLIPIWLSCLMFHVVLAQLHTFFTKQGSTMIRSMGPHFQLPPASLQGLVGFTILISVVIYDRVFVPLARKITGHPAGITVLQRIGVGLFLSVLTMVTAALVETKRVNVAKSHGLLDNPKAILPMAVWWLFPQYMMCGLADCFAIVGLQELFYSQMPEAMRSMGAAAYISLMGVGSFLSSGIISLVQVISSKCGEEWLGNNLNRAHLDDFYWVIAGLSTLSFVVYVWMAKDYVYYEEVHQFGSEETTMVKDQKFNYSVDGEV